jgi:hypothetical protein
VKNPNQTQDLKSFFLPTAFPYTKKKKTPPGKKERRKKKKKKKKIIFHGTLHSNNRTLTAI